ncbi:MAG: hypothetical protein PSU94_02750 [Lacunisphaera sp.]|nr:hypothetical protein [Lacunisphaera sp.]
MARTIRQVCLKILAGLLRPFSRPGPAGWSRSTRPTSLRGK